MELRELRKQAGLTQKEAADKAGVSLRTYVTYENYPDKRNKIKYDYITRMLEDIVHIDEKKGILKIESIISLCADVLKQYNVEFCYLFGSYAKGMANETSDVDLLVASDVKGLQFFGMTEKLREKLKKKVDVLNFEQLDGNIHLTKEIMKDGIKIYG